MATVNVNGATLYYKEAGTGEPLLLIHGTGFNADVWDGVFDSLAQEYRTIAYDRRGYQRSTGPLPPKASYGSQQGDDIIGLLEALKATPTTLLGWSAGGIHSLYAALKRPDLIKHLVLYEPPLYATKYLDLAAILMFIKLNLLKAIGRRQQAANTFVRWVLGYKDGRNSYDRLSTDFRLKLAHDADTLLAEFAGGAGEDLKPEMLQAGIKMPVTLLLGELSPAVIHKMVSNLANIIRVPVIYLPDANHLAQVDQPAEFVRAVKNSMADRH